MHTNGQQLTKNKKDFSYNIRVYFPNSKLIYISEEDIYGNY